MGFAILSHFKLTLAAELRLLNRDLDWWNSKFVYRPELKAAPQLETLIEELKSRIVSLERLFRGELTSELIQLAPYSIKSTIKWEACGMLNS